MKNFNSLLFFPINVSGRYILLLLFALIFFSCTSREKKVENIVNDYVKLMKDGKYSDGINKYLANERICYQQTIFMINTCNSFNEKYDYLDPVFKVLKGVNVPEYDDVVVVLVKYGSGEASFVLHKKYTKWRIYAIEADDLTPYVRGLNSEILGKMGIDVFSEKDWDSLFD